MEYVLEFILPPPPPIFAFLWWEWQEGISRVSKTTFLKQNFTEDIFVLIALKKNVTEIRLLCLCVAEKKINKTQCVQMKGNYPM